MKMGLKKMAAMSAAVLGLAGGVVALENPEPAHAARALGICNHPSSDDNIIAYRIEPPFQEWSIGAGHCASTNNDGGAIRVDMDPAGGRADIDSWKHRYLGGNWFSCHLGEDGSVNPANDEDHEFLTSSGTTC